MEKKMYLNRTKVFNILSQKSFSFKEDADYARNL